MKVGGQTREVAAQCIGPFHIRVGGDFPDLFEARRRAAACRVGRA
jgi:hypothetical protein